MPGGGTMRYGGLVFDFNGVLWWDGHLQEQAWRQFSAEIRGWPFSEEEMAVQVHGRNNGHTLAYLMGRVLEVGELAQLSERKETIYRQLCLDQGSDFRLSPGAAELLDYLVAHRIPHTIATASGKGNLDFFVTHLHLDRWFDVGRIVFDDGLRPGKPAPDLYLQAASNLGLEPGRCVVVEDSRSGIQAARAAGIGYVIALGPAHTHSRLARLEGVDAIVESLWQVPRERLFL
jgi:beta-phosphoglucomutase-like phosphatase (HAD superfamily)